MVTESKAIDAINRTNAAFGETYVSNNMKFEQGALGATFGAIKRNIIDTARRAIGLDPNVSQGYANIMADPNMAINANGKTYYPHTGIGNLHPYNEAGNPAGGCFSLHEFG